MPPTHKTMSNPWILFHKPRPQARLRLLCFPYAGGGALVYRDWAASLPDEIDVLPVQLPGRERRLSEAPFTRVGPLVEVAARQLVPFLDRPYAIFGHSMGALIAYEMAQRLWHHHGLEPAHLLVSARRAPQMTAEPKRYYQLPDDELIETLREMGGTPVEVLDHPELMELMLPLLRADFELNDTYQPIAHPALECPVSAFGGIEDIEVQEEDLALWKEVTNGPFQLRMFSGGHFFLNDHRDPLLELIAQDLLRQNP